MNTITTITEYNAWDLIFTQFSTDDNWYNIEEIIEDATDKDNDFIKGLITRCIFGEKKNTSDEYGDIYSLLLPYFSANYTEKMSKIKELAPIQDFSQQITKGNKILSSILFEELIKEENAFMQYLQNAVSSIPYKTRANDLLQIMENRYPNDRERSGPIGTIGRPMIHAMSLQVILSFNYTEFIERKPYTIFANINGSLSDKNSFFGTSDKGDNFTFTKTSRLSMTSTHPRNRDIAMEIIRKAPRINCINIFGHSLQEPDDALFIQVFKQAKIKEQKTPIRFFYTVDPEHGFDRQELVFNAKNLIDRYAQDNGTLYSELTQQQLITFDELKVSW